MHDYEFGPDGYPLLWSEAEVEGRLSGFVCGREVAPTTGSLHLQGYVECKNQATLSALLKWPMFFWEKESGHSVRLLVAKGTAAENQVYCTKEDKAAYCFGVFIADAPGKRNDWDTARALAQRGASAAEFMDEVPHLAMPHINKIPQWVAGYSKNAGAKREWTTRLIVYFGPTGCGKTYQMQRAAKEAAAVFGQEPYYKSDSDKWWPGYAGESIVVIDEMDGSFFKFSDIKRFLDSSPYTVQYKGGSCEFLGKTVYTATNNHPSTWYEKSQAWDSKNPLFRRIRDSGELWIFSEPTMDGDVWVKTNCLRDTLKPLLPPPPQAYELDDDDRAYAASQNRLDHRGVAFPGIVNRK